MPGKKKPQFQGPEGTKLSPDDVMQRSGWIAGTREGISWATGREKPDVTGVGRRILEARQK